MGGTVPAGHCPGDVLVVLAVAGWPEILLHLAQGSLVERDRSAGW
jgi:hypothetical protein